MGLRVAGVIISTSFLLGILLSHWTADSLTLWQTPLTDEHLRTAAIYYGTFASLPINMLWALVGIAAFGASCLLASIREGQAGNLMFDGASIFLYMSAMWVYWMSVIPNLGEIRSRPLPLEVPAGANFPEALRKPTVALASSHLVCSVALTGVLFFQALRSWAEDEDRTQREDDEREEQAERELERLRTAAEGARGRHKVDEDEQDEPASPTSPNPGMRKSVSARRKEGSRLSTKGSSLGRASGSGIRRMS